MDVGAWMRLWSTRGAQDGPQRRHPPSFFKRPRGWIDAGDAPIERGMVQLLGWASIPNETVVRVEVAIDGGPWERARVGIERLDIRDICPLPGAALCGFEHKVDLSSLPADANEVHVDAIAYGSGGTRLELPRVTREVVAAEPPFDDDPRAAELRARTARRALRHRPDGRKTRILAFAHQLDYSGASLYLSETLRRICAADDVECELVTLLDGPLRPELERVGIPVHLTDCFPVTSVERYEGHQAELRAWLDACGGFDVAFVNTLGAFVGADLISRAGIPFVWAIHESFTLADYWFTAYPPGSLHPYARARAEQSLRRANALVFEAEATRQLYVDHVDPHKLLTIPYGVELDAIDATRRARSRADVRRELGFADETTVILCLGTIEARKSQAALVEAFALLGDRHPNAQLVLVGETDAGYCADYIAGIHDYVARNELGGRIRIERVTPDPYSWHLAADVVVCSSDVESLPRVLIEAMAFGTPVLSTRVFGIPELIEDGHTGYLYEPRDITALVDALDRVLGTPASERRVIAAAGERRARQRHDAARYASRIDALIRESAAPREVAQLARA